MSLKKFLEMTAEEVVLWNPEEVFMGCEERIETEVNSKNVAEISNFYDLVEFMGKNIYQDGMDLYFYKKSMCPEDVLVYGLRMNGSYGDIDLEESVYVIDMGKWAWHDILANWVDEDDIENYAEVLKRSDLYGEFLSEAIESKIYLRLEGK